MSAPLFSWDTETCLLAPGMAAPPLVCLQFALDDGPEELIHARDPACRRTVVQALESWHFNGQNLAFDTVVICAQWPDLTPLVFQAYEADRMSCTVVRQKLIDIAKGTFKVQSKKGYSLDMLAMRNKLPITPNKQDEWRMRYGTLLETPISEWPEGAIRYAKEDATVQRLLYRAQEAYAASQGIPLVDEFRQTRAALWLRLLEARGIMVDPVRVEQYIANVRETLEVDREMCVDAGLVRKDGTRDTKAAMAYMARICEETEEPLPVTDTGAEVMEAEGLDPWALWKKHGKYVKLDEDSCQQYGDETLEAYQRFSTATTQLARAERLALAARRGVPIQASFGTLQDTGRTSCSQGDKRKAHDTSPVTAYGSQLQNPAKDKKIKRKDGSTFVRKGTREVFVPRPGYVFCSTDWEGAEASGFAQVCLWTVGFSKLAEVINAGGNLPTEFGARVAGVSLETALAWKKAGGPEWKSFNDRERQVAKVILYGSMAAMGPAKLRLAARKQYSLSMTEEQAREYRRALFEFAPEFPAYFKYVERQLSGPRESRYGDLVQWKSGRVRGRCNFKQYANGGFQAIIADCFKDAGWRIAREMYVDRRSPLFGSRMANEVHDDILSELLEDRGHEAGFRQAEIMEEAGRDWLPDVALRCRPALMRRWEKGAEEVHRDEAGLLWKSPGPGRKLVPWEHGQKYEKA